MSSAPSSPAGNVVDLAIGIIIGAAFTGVVNSLVKDVVNPIIGWRSAAWTQQQR